MFTRSPDPGPLMGKNDSGYTLLELMIAMQLTLLVLGLTIWGYGYTTKLLHKWQTSTARQIDASQYERALEITINRIHSIHQANTDMLSGTSKDGSEIQIRQFESYLLINTKRLLKVHKVNFRYILLRNGEIAELNQVPDAWRRYIAAIEVEIIPAIESSNPIRMLRRMKWGKAKLKYR